MLTQIKFCGLTRSADAAVANELGAAYAGVIMTPSIRRVTPEAAREIFSGSPGARRVGVFRGESIAEIIKAATVAELDIVQLHRQLSPEHVEHLRSDFDGEIWTVIGVEEGASAFPGDWEYLADVCDALLLDTSASGLSGGTGRLFDWVAVAPVVQEMSKRLPVVVAGGLTAENVGKAISTLHPHVVDVSSGVEVEPGIKDSLRMRAFAEAVHSASIV